MKALPRILGLLLISMLVFNNSKAQKANFTTGGGMTIGLGVGAASQKSDIANSSGLGFDLVLGSQLYKKENAFFSVDWKFRFLAGENKAYDHRINPDNTFSNIHYSFTNYDLELGLTLNRLRERTRIVLSGFVGAGITYGHTFTDLYDANSILYNYSSVDPNRDRSLVYDDLLLLSDGDFETQLSSKASLLPTAGFFIGYQFSRSMSVGIEFKTNFYLTEQNSLTGINLDNSIVTGSAMDRNNYVSLGLKWNLKGGSSYNSTTSNYTPNPNLNTVVPGSLPGPLVTIIRPSDDSYHTVSFSQTIKATVSNVSGHDDISFFHNGFPNYNFTFNASTKIFAANVSLREGENSFRIKARNQTSVAEAKVSITLDELPEEEKSVPVSRYTPHEEDQLSPPIEHIEPIAIPTVRFINPDLPLAVENVRFNLRAEVQNVQRRNDIRLKVNGVSTGNFSFNTYGVVSSTVLLSEGDNTIEITASNEAGTTSDRAIITYVKPIKIIFPPVNDVPTPINVVPTPVNDVPEPAIDNHTPLISQCPPPEIRLINPGQGQINTNQQSYTLRAEVLNIANRNQLRLRANRQTLSFRYSNNMLSSSIPLVSGVNTITLNAKNECGEDNVSTRITYTPPVEAEPCTSPVLSLGVYEISFYGATHELRGSISGVDSKADISLTVDGRANNGFQYIPSTGVLNAKFKFASGSHTLVVSVKNACGTDSKSKTVSIEEEEEEEVTVVVEEEEECAVRINPGNSTWQFCLQTPSGTFTRENLRNARFSYSGSASSLYFMPIGGGGEVTVNGRSYPVRSGQYYLFTGGINVSVSNNHTGSMGYWSVCVSSNKAPVTGNGNNRPKSPCEPENDNKNDKNPGKGNSGENGKK